MKKIFLSILLLGIFYSCSPDHETKVNGNENTSPAYKIYFAEYSNYNIGYMYADSVEKSFTFIDADSGLNSPNGIFYNQAGKKLYVTEGDESRILRVIPQDYKIVATYDSDQGVLNPTCIAIDTLGKKIYWANSGTSQIMQGELFGSVNDPVALFDGEEIITICYGIAIDHKNGKIYFSDNLNNTISVGNLDGTGTPTVLFSSDLENVRGPQSLVLSGSTLYWANDANNTVVSANVSGKEEIVVLFNEDDGVSYPNGVAVDAASKKIYWTEVDSNIIARGNLDGTGDREIILENVQPNSISIQYK